MQHTYIMIIFLYGEDFFRSSQKVAEIKNKFLEKDPVASGLSIFDFEPARNATPASNASRSDANWHSVAGGDKAEIKKVLNVLSTANLLAPKRLVIVKNLISAGLEIEQEEMLSYFKKNKSIESDSDAVIIFWENCQPKKGNALFKFLESKKIETKIQKFEKLSGVKLAGWIMKRIMELDAKAKISKTALDKLMIFSGDNMILLDKEIQKLVNYADGKVIKEEDIELLVKADINNNIFHTIDALANGNKKEALKLLHNHLKKGEDPFYILAMFIYQFRNLIKVADLKENQNAGEYEIAKISKLHPFVVKKSLGQMRNFSASGQAFGKLKNIYQKLSDLDTKVKTGKIEIKLGLDKFIIEL